MNTNASGTSIQSNTNDIGIIDSERKKVVYPFLKKEYTLKPEEEIRLLMVEKLINEYDYQLDQIGIEIPVKAGQVTLPKRADIVVFKSLTNHDPVPSIAPLSQSTRSL